MEKHLIWIDLEMTGLDPETYVIVEIASIVTDNQLNIVAEGPDIAINHPDAILSAMEPWSLEHHQASGLTDRIKASPYTCAQAEAETLSFLSKYCEKGASPPLRQFHRAGPPLSGETHAGAGGFFPLPQHRRQYHQGVGQTMVPFPFPV